jgi:hypothetical protein
MSDKQPELPRRSDSYEKQLSDGELHSLHSQLLAGKFSLKQLRLQLPKWRSGRFAGQPPSVGTLHNIHERLCMEETLKENEATTGSLLEELAASDPSLTQDQLTRLGDNLFLVQSIREQNVKQYDKVRRLQQKDRQQEMDHRKLKLLEAKAAQADQAEKVTKDETLTEEEKRARYRQIFGMS